MDRAKCTPLHTIVSYKKIVSDFLTLHAIIMALLEHGKQQSLLYLSLTIASPGAHIDSVNGAGQTPLAAATTGVAEIILKSQSEMSLKCLAAQTIRKFNLKYHGQVAIFVNNEKVYCLVFRCRNPSRSLFTSTVHEEKTIKIKCFTLRLDLFTVIKLYDL